MVSDDALIAAEVKGAALDSDFLKKEDDPALKDTGWEA
jgi:hypothetical protein